MSMSVGSYTKKLVIDQLHDKIEARGVQ